MVKVGEFLLKAGQGDQISKLKGFLLQLDWVGWRQGRKDGAWTKIGLIGARLKLGQGKGLCESLHLFKERSSTFFSLWTLQSVCQLVTFCSWGTSWTTCWDLDSCQLLYCATQRHLIEGYLWMQTEIRSWTDLYAQLHRPSGIHLEGSQNLSSFLRGSGQHHGNNTRDCSSHLLNLRGHDRDIVEVTGAKVEQLFRVQGATLMDSAPCFSWLASHRFEASGYVVWGQGELA